MAERSAATLTVKDAAAMTDASRHSIAAWLRLLAERIESDGDSIAPRYRAQYLRTDQTDYVETGE